MITSRRLLFLAVVLALLSLIRTHAQESNFYPSQTIASGVATMSNGTPIGSGACAATPVTVAASGVVTTDIIAATFNGSPIAITGYVPGAMLSIIPYPTAGNVNFIVCNNTGSSITPSSAVLNWKVLR